MGHPGGETRGLRHFGWAQTWWMMTHYHAGQVLCFAGLHQQAQRWLRRWTACSPYRMQVRAHVEDHAREAVVLGGLTLEGVRLEAPDSVQPEELPRPLVLRRYHSQIDRRRSHGRQRSHPKETSVLMSRKSPGLGTRTSLATLPVIEDAVQECWLPPTHHFTMDAIRAHMLAPKVGRQAVAFVKAVVRLFRPFWRPHGSRRCRCRCWCGRGSRSALKCQRLHYWR